LTQARISLIWAMTRNRVIGRDNDLPWHLPDEMRHFMRTTSGHPVIMGRKQFEAMGKALPKRTNIVMTRSRTFRAEGALVVADLDAALVAARADAAARGVDEIFVIGGAEIYALALPIADRLYFTLIDADIEGDTRFPPFDENAWREVSRESHPIDARHPYAFTIRILERR
jgi:dihydrofolate reductase